MNRNGAFAYVGQRFLKVKRVQHLLLRRRMVRTENYGHLHHKIEIEFNRFIFVVEQKRT